MDTYPPPLSMDDLWIIGGVLLLILLYILWLNNRPKE
jgi:hypothetical protein